MPAYGLRHYVIPYDYMQLNFPTLSFGLALLFAILFIIVLFFLLYCVVNYAFELFSGRSLRARRLARKKERRKSGANDVVAESRADQSSSTAYSSDNN